MKKIIFTGGNGRFGKVLKKYNFKDSFYFPNKKDLNITSIRSIERYLKKTKAKYLIHAAALSRPMSIHEKDIAESIRLNIIGTSNVVIACKKYSVKLIYFSTNYVYPGIKGNYSESDPIKPINNYALSKLGGEAAVKMYENSLILRICMTEKPFVHKKAFKDVEMNFLFHEDLAKNLIKLIKHKGIINVGGPTKTVYEFAKKNNKKIIPIKAKKIFGKNYPTKQSMNVKRYKNIIKN